MDAAQQDWADKTDLKWSRPFEVVNTTVEQQQQPVVQGMSKEDAQYFTAGARAGFKFIGKRHSMTPVQTWGAIQNGMNLLGIHIDDAEILQAMLFGWEELTPEQLQRWALRYPKRCPLLDAMCSLDSTCAQLNATQDWLLAAKGSYGRTRSDVLPALPEPDGVRPAIRETTKSKDNTWGVVPFINA